jgi:hypothetical protein
MFTTYIRVLEARASRSSAEQMFDRISRLM